MDITPRLVALLAFAALLPFAAFALGSGEMTPAIAAVSLVDILLVVGSIITMFGPVGDSEFAGTAAG